MTALIGIAVIVLTIAAVFAALNFERLGMHDVSVAPKDHEQVGERLLHEVATLTDAAESSLLTADRVARLAIPLLADWVIVYQRCGDAMARLFKVAAEDQAGEEALEHALHALPRQFGGKDPMAIVAEVLRTGAPSHVPNAPPHGLASAGRNPGERICLASLEAGSLVIAPLHARGRLWGAMVFGRSRNSDRYPESDVTKIVEYAQRAAVMIDSAEQFETALSAKAEAESARDQLSAIVDNLSSGYIALDHNGRVTHMNRAAEEITARSRAEMLGREFWQAVPPNTREGPLARFALAASVKQKAATSEFSVTWSDKPCWLEIRVEPMVAGLALYLRDVTERRAMAKRLAKQEDALRQSQKMEAVGRLSGRLAHDFNNLLLSIAGCAELLSKKVGDDASVREDIDEILRSTERASSLTRQLLTYSRKQVHQPRVIDLGTTIAEMQRRLLHVLREDILLVVNVPDELATVKVDPNQIEQMLLNFAVNSLDAMASGGILTITVSNTELQAARHGEHERLQPGRYVSLEVSDTGRGIDPAVVPHIFEPFFTTKSADKGTGLGLASVYGIVRQNHGSITVKSIIGRGTKFEVLFPFVGCEEDAQAAAPAGTPALPSVKPVEDCEPAEGVILVAEDEHSVRRFVCEVLREQGYTVLEARTGVEGVAVARRCEGPIDLLLTDVVMPEMGGRDLAAQLVETNPETRILFMSGYAENEIAHHGVLATGAQLVEKPFSRAMLLERVRLALSEPPADLRFSSPAA